MSDLAHRRPASNPGWRRWCWRREKALACTVPRPKPLHRLCGRPMVMWVLGALGGLDLSRVVVVVGHGSTRMTKALAEAGSPAAPLEVVEQPVQRGTGDALSVALTAFHEDDGELDDLVVLPGDTPLLRPGTLAALVAAHRSASAAATLLTTRLDDPSGYGRVVRSRDGRVAAIVEEADATEEERAIDEVGTSIYAFRRSVLAPALRRLSPDNAPGRVLPDRRHLRAARRRLPRHLDGGPGAHRGQRGQRPLPAGGGRGRAAGTDKRAVDAPGCHHARPAPHLPRLDGRARRGRHHFSRDYPSRAARESPPVPSWDRALIWSTAPSERGLRCGRLRRSRW